MSFVFRFVFLVSAGPVFLFGQELTDDDVWLESLLGGGEGGLVETTDGDTSSSFEEARVDLASIIALSGWNRDLSFALGTGWRENVLLESAGGVDAPYSQIEVDFFALRPGTSRRAEILAMVYGDYRYFSRVAGMDVESLTLAQGSATWRLGRRWNAGGILEGMHSVQAFDASEADFETAASTVRVWQPEVGVSLAGDFGNLGSVDWKSKYGLVFYDQEGEDFDRWTNSVLWKKSLSEGSRVRFGFDWYRENYEERTERMSRSVLLDAGLLVVDGGRLKGSWSWDFENGFWPGIKTSFSFERERGAVGDYYDRDRMMGKQSLEFALLGWKGFLSAAYGETDFKRRLAVVGEEATRFDRSWRWSVEGTRRMGKRFEFLVRFDLTEKDSNALGLSYEGSGISMGVRVNDLGGFWAEP